MNLSLLLLIIFIIVIVLLLKYRTRAEFFITNIAEDTINNNSWRKVLNTSNNMQLVAMSVPPAEELGWEVHNNDQLFRIERGNGEIRIGNAKKYKSNPLTDDTLAIVPSGNYHNIINTGNTPLKFYTVYSPPHHPANTEDFTHKDEITRENL
jgi:mannose-6-phosphate isomerase-like protein (cupin superfamily)